MVHVVAVRIANNDKGFECEDRKDEIPRANGGALRENIRKGEGEVAQKSKIRIVAFKAGGSSAFGERRHVKRCRSSCEMVA